MTTRKDFLAVTAAVAAVPGVAAAQTPAPSASPLPPASAPYTLDVAAFDGLLAGDAPHKHLFAAKLIGEGAIFDNMRSTLNAYKSIGTPFSDVKFAGVLYHDAMVLGLDDHVWTTYIIPLVHAHRKDAPPDLLKIITPKTRGNPCMLKQGGAWDASIPALIELNAPHFFVCNNALTGYAHAVAKMLKRNPDAVRNEWAAHLVPNATLVPAGVWAIHAIQERKYTLLQSS